MKQALALLGLLLLVNLAACSTSKEEREQEAKEQEAKEEKEAQAKKAVETYKQKLICPQVAVLRELETIRDQAAAAKMEGVNGDCGYRDDGIDIAFRLTFTAVRAASDKDKIEFPFFVAVVDPNGAILNKDQMNAKFRFKGDDRNTTEIEPMHVFIPLPKIQRAAGPNYRVLTGFQLSEQQLVEVRKSQNPGLPAKK